MAEIAEDKSISELSLASKTSGKEFIPVVQDGETKKIQVGNIANRRSGKFAGRKVVAFGSRSPNFVDQFSDGIATTETSQFVGKNIGIVTELAVYFLNADSINATVPDEAADITIEASVEYPIGTWTRITFNNGSTNFLLRRGSGIVSDTINIYIPPNTWYRIRTNVTVNPGEKWQKSRSTNAGNTGPGEGVVTGSNLVMSGTIPNSQSYGFGPCAIVGISDTNKASILWAGDSIVTGHGDSGQPSLGNGESGGYLGRLFGDQWPVMRCNMSGQRIIAWIRSSSRNSWAYDELLSSCDYVICNLGINDFRAGSSKATIISRTIEFWYYFYSRGVEAYQCTITPNTTSTDGWTTTENQTVMSFESDRVGMNDWIRDGAPIDITTKAAAAIGATGSNIVRFGEYGHPAIGYFDCADKAETSRNSGKWRVNRTGDGLHPNNISYGEIVTAFDTNLFLLYKTS
ncbi:hypothetical protein MYP_638 [Sporocytophaga myxococcoides]|uniref:Uncharacterized protein n=1 Tax=Sporocytophaga myxococcoides TaxID=153721 RepID=A0A098L952_9BACT|nr:SGNH/GDSL hydrolase family protein [Sporocytophaga myxococcoides]GAL83411.1 hypothetical protein MYP_638 [Sporocytophaga myxococcoides]